MCGHHLRQCLVYSYILEPYTASVWHSYCNYYYEIFISLNHTFFILTLGRIWCWVFYISIWDHVTDELTFSVKFKDRRQASGSWWVSAAVCVDLTENKGREPGYTFFYFSILVSCWILYQMEPHAIKKCRILQYMQCATNCLEDVWQTYQTTHAPLCH